MTRSSRYKTLGALCLGLLATSACGPGGDVNPKDNKFLIYNYSPSNQDYRLERVNIHTLTNVEEASGEYAYLLGGGTLDTGTEDPKTESEWKNYLVVNGASAPQIEYTVDDDGTVVPWDFDSAMMLTVYHHLERSREYFDTINADGLGISSQTVGQEVGRMKCYYYPGLAILGIPLPLFTDNAAYAYTADAFLIPPRLSLADAVPIYANRGVITHEFGHAVFNRLVHNNRRGTTPLVEKWEENAIVALNELGGLDEGIADVFGALDTKDPDFIAYSVDAKLIDRDMEVDRYYEACLFSAARALTEVVDDQGNVSLKAVYPAAAGCGGNYGDGIADGTDSKGVRFDYQPGGAYDSHHLGAVVASIFWDLRAQVQGTLDDTELGYIVAKTLRDIQNPTQSFRIAMFFDALHNNLPASAQSQACSLFHERLPAIKDELQCQP